MNKQREQEFKFRCERLAKRIAQNTDIIFTQIRYTELVRDEISDKRLMCTSLGYGIKNRIQVTFVGVGVGAQNLTVTRRNAINRILKTNAKVIKDSPMQTHQVEITFNVNPHKM